MKKTFILRPYPHPSRELAIEAIKSASDGFKVTIQPAPRSLAQNDLSHEIYALIAQAKPEDDALGWKCYCKLHHGVPILRAEDDEFKAMYDSAIKGLAYEQKLQVMKFMPVTSLMNKEQKSRYIDSVMNDDLLRDVRFDAS